MEDGLLVIDVGGTRTKSGVYEDGEVSHLAIQETKNDYDALWQDIKDIYQSYGERKRWAIALPGNFTSDGMWKGFSENLPPEPIEVSWPGLPTPMSCQDTRAALVGEANGQAITLLQISDGIGVGGTNEEGEPLLDEQGELLGLWNAHKGYDPTGPFCPRCGLNGCIASYASLGGILKRHPEVSSPSDLLSDNPEITRSYKKAIDALVSLAKKSVEQHKSHEVRLAGGSAIVWQKELVPALRKALPSSVVVSVSCDREKAPLRGLGLLYKRTIS